MLHVYMPIRLTHFLVDADQADCNVEYFMHEAVNYLCAYENVYLGEEERYTPK